MVRNARFYRTVTTYWLGALIALLSASASQAQLKGFVLAPTDLATTSRSVQDLADRLKDSQGRKVQAKLLRYQLWMPYRSLAEHIQIIQQIMPTIQSRGMVLVVDMHCPNPGDTKFPIKDVAAFTRHWEQLSEKLGKYPPQNLWYELANEQERSDWRKVATDAAQAIRRVEKAKGFQQHTICYSPTGVTTVPARSIQKLDIPGPQVLTFHFWNWKDVSRSFDVQEDDIRCPDPKKLARYGSSGRTKEVLIERLEEVKEAGRRNGCPVYISEVGIRKDHPDAAKFVTDFTTEASRRGIHVTWHAFREAKTWDLEGTSSWPKLMDWLR